jgi:hypothetical protein
MRELFRMLRTVILALIGLGLLIQCTKGYGQVIEEREFRPVSDAPYGTQRFQRPVQIGPSCVFPVIVDVTPKGNGWMKVANLQLRVYKDHDDGSVFDPSLLHVEFVDLTGNGYKDLVIIGTLENTGEKDGDPVSTEPIASIYMFNPKTNQFSLSFRYGLSLEHSKSLFATTRPATTQP